MDRQMAQRGREEEKLPAGLEQELQLLERQAREASPGYETQFLNRAGNLCVEAGSPKRALGYYGRAIDAYLESGRFSAAEVVCKKLLRMAPDAVRARCTLAWLAIGKGYRSGTDEELADYVRAAEKANREPLAAKQLRMMAEAAVSPDLREVIGEHLLELGDAEGADEVFGGVFLERNGLRPAPVTDEGKLWGKLLRAALMGPEELKDHRASGEAEAGGMLPGLITQLEQER
jgi:tetratricopeptide (TPR) repeat protein